MADETTYEEALKGVKIIINGWGETAKELGREIPEPKGRLIYV
jgi:predicted RNase H-like HicB family nuclease